MLPPAFPSDHVGLISLPGGSQRRVWWTGRVAIGLRYQPPPPPGPMSQSATWIQNLLLS